MKPLGPKLRALKDWLNEIPARLATAVPSLLNVTLAAPAKFLFWFYGRFSPDEPKRPLSHWGVLNGLLWAAGAYLSLPNVTDADTPGSVTDRLVASAVSGLLIVGVAQLMRGSAHGAASEGGKRVDGLGKALGVFGWSLGATSAVIFRAVGTGVSDEMLLRTALLLGASGVLACFISLIPVNKTPGGARIEDVVAMTVTETAPDVEAATAPVPEVAHEVESAIAELSKPVSEGVTAMVVEPAAENSRSARR